MKHLGDITKINGAVIEPVNCVTFGSPCQDLSVAGKRAGLDGERSGLFMEAARIIKEMRDNDERTGRTGVDVRPRFAVWENVPGAFTSNNGEDFRAVLEELVRIKDPGAVVPRPLDRKGKPVRWTKSGVIRFDGGSLAWRTMDAQFWGVPQRRRRITVIVDFAGECAAEILFERVSLSGNSEQGIKAWKGIARNPEESIGECNTEQSETLQVRCGCDGGQRSLDSARTERNALDFTDTDTDTFQTVREDGKLK